MTPMLLLCVLFNGRRGTGRHWRPCTAMWMWMYSAQWAMQSSAGWLWWWWWGGWGAPRRPQHHSSSSSAVAAVEMARVRVRGVGRGPPAAAAAAYCSPYCILHRRGARVCNQRSAASSSS
jgi:hypothetical protein